MLDMIVVLVVGISPLLQGRNGYLPSIGWKDRVLGGGCKENRQEKKENRNKKPSAHKVMG